MIFLLERIMGFEFNHSLCSSFKGIHQEQIFLYFSEYATKLPSPSSNTVQMTHPVHVQQFSIVWHIFDLKMSQHYSEQNFLFKILLFSSSCQLSIFHDQMGSKEREREIDVNERNDKVTITINNDNNNNNTIDSFNRSKFAI